MTVPLIAAVAGWATADVENPKKATTRIPGASKHGHGRRCPCRSTDNGLLRDRFLGAL